MLRPLLLAALLSVTLTACSSDIFGTKITGTAAQVCETWKPVFPSRDDKLTTGTKEQIAGNNEANRKWCGDSGPPPKAPVKTS